MRTCTRWDHGSERRGCALQGAGSYAGSWGCPCLAGGNSARLSLRGLKCLTAGAGLRLAFWGSFSKVGPGALEKEDRGKRAVLSVGKLEKILGELSCLGAQHGL